MQTPYSGGEKGHPDGYQLIRGEVVHLHLKDFVTDPTAGRHHRRSTYIGEGEVPHEDIFRDLLKDGYDGAASIEHGVRHFEEAHARRLGLPCILRRPFEPRKEQRQQQYQLAAPYSLKLFCLPSRS